MSTCLAYVETSKNFEGKVEHDRRIFDLFSRETLAMFFEDMQGVTVTHTASPPELTEAEFNKLHDRLFPKMKARGATVDELQRYLSYLRKNASSTPETR
jgi:hypothetical protein